VSSSWSIRAEALRCSSRREISRQRSMNDRNSDALGMTPCGRECKYDAALGNRPSARWLCRPKSACGDPLENPVPADSVEKLAPLPAAAPARLGRLLRSAQDRRSRSSQWVKDPSESAPKKHQ
jgi:hypothetical protein